MTTRIVSRPDVEEWHPCSPAWSYHEQRPYDPATMLVPDPPSAWSMSIWANEPAGTVAECNECGQRWVVAHQPQAVTGGGRRHHRHLLVTMAYNYWRKETPRERRRRERKARRG
jgi:hypothetical protein